MTVVVTERLRTLPSPALGVDLDEVAIERYPQVRRCDCGLDELSSQYVSTYRRPAARLYSHSPTFMCRYTRDESAG